MATSGYCLKFYLNATHSMIIDQKRSEKHSHTWEISLFIKRDTEEFIEFDKLEKLINLQLDYFQNKYINENPPFDVIEPTLENIGDVLYIYLKETLSCYAFSTIKLEVSETPTRAYVVTGDSQLLKEYEANLEGKQIDPIEPNPFLVNNFIEFITENVANPATESEKKEIIENNSQQPKIDEPAASEVHPLYSNIVPPESMKMGTNRNPHEKFTTSFKITLSLLIITTSTIMLILYVDRNGISPWGSDAFGHLFKADLLYKNMMNGNIYPLYTNLWYNGIQPFRYWAPFPYYLLAAFEVLTKGNIIVAYTVFMGFSFFVGALGWLMWGIKEKRIFVSLIFGLLWFCMPDNIRVFFSEGNVPRDMVAIILPYILYFIWQFVEYQKKYALPVTMLLMMLAVFCHIMIAAMIGITAFVFLLYYGIINKRLGPSIQMIIGMLISFAICGVWLYPALQGGLLSMDTDAVSSVMKALTFPFTESLNPLLRLKNIEIFYFGISVVAISIAGIILSKKKSTPGFLTVLTIFLGTTTALVPILIKLPLNQLLWMMRFTPLVYGIFFLSLLTWTNVKKTILFVIVSLIIVDCGVSFKLLAFNVTPSASMKNTLDVAKSATSQRIAVLDDSEFGSFVSYYLTTGKNPVQYAYGWAWLGATTAQNIVLLNTALDDGYYIYMFDRCIELGCDTVLVKKDKIKDLSKLINGGLINQYKLIHEDNNAYLFKRQTPSQFGLTVKYYGLAIGRSAPNISLEFPGFEIGNSLFIDDYSLDALLSYKVIYLSDFKYHLLTKAQNLVKEASQKGVKFVIDMNRVPSDPITNRMTFLGVTAQPILFEKQLPNLFCTGITYFPTTFKKENQNWNTVYLEGLDNSLGFSWFGGDKIDFIGTSVNPNITFIGFNLLYFGIVNKDEGVVGIFETAMGIMRNTLPDRTIVPIKIEYKGNNISIQSPVNNVDTTLANLDAFVPQGKTFVKHNLLFIKDKKVNIKIGYPYLMQGIVLSAVGLLIAIIFVIFVIKRRKNSEN